MQATRKAALTLYLQKAMHARKDRQWPFAEMTCAVCLPRPGVLVPLTKNFRLNFGKILKKFHWNFAGNSGCLVRLSVRHLAVGTDAAAWVWLSMQD